MVTGALDSRSLIEFRELWKPGTTVEITQCTHIFAEPTNDGVEDEQKVPILSCRQALHWFTPPLKGTRGARLGDHSRIWM